MDYNKKNDNEIIYMIRENEEDYRNLMIQKYMPIIKRLACDYYSVYKEKGAEIDDFIQEGMIALNKAINSFDEQNNIKFYTYAVLCIKRNMITFCRNLSSRKHYFLNNSVRDEEIYLNLEGNEVNWEYLNGADFVKLKNSLDVKYSPIFELRFNGFSYKEISTLLDVPISTVDSRINKIKSSLHKIIGKTIY